MKTVILAGGLGSRLGEETAVRPKPMVEIGGRPIIWHIMKIYSAHGLNDFVLCLGYKGYMIKEYFANYFLHMSDVTFDLSDNSMTVHQHSAEPWRVTLVDTGPETQTGGRLKAVRRYLDEGEDFCFTYGDGVSNVDVTALLAFHKGHGKRLTITAVAPPGRFGAVETEDDRVVSFMEKPAGDGGRINGGFSVGHTSVLDLVEGPATPWERGPMETLARTNQMMAFRHDGFWAAMDTPRDKTVLEAHWASGAAPWKVW
jgi:glucose-1-phosphate cytidylyltransferase